MSRNERFKLVAYTIGIVITAPFIGDMLVRAWGADTPAYRLLSELLPLLGLPPAPEGIVAVASFGLGLYLALLTLYANDVRKRIQGVLLFGGTVIVLGVLGTAGIFFVYFDPMSQLNWAMFITGVGLGLAVEYPNLTRMDFSKSQLGYARSTSGRSITFNNATIALYVIMFGVLGGGLAQTVLNEALSVLDVVVVAIFLALLYWFLGHRSEHEYQVLGPEQSGKSMFQLGLFLERTQRWKDQPVRTSPNPSPGMRDLITQLQDYDPVEDGWPTTSNELNELGLVQIWFEYTAGDKFPIHVVMGAIDHAGQHLKDIAQTLQPDKGMPMTDGGTSPGESPREDAESAQFSGSSVSEEELPVADEVGETTATDDLEDSEPEVSGVIDEFEEEEISVSMTEFLERVTTADTLILLLDCERIKDPGASDAFADPRLHADELDTIVQHTDDRTVFLVGAKADYYLDEFFVKYGFEGSAEEDPELFDAFRDFVTHHLQQDEMVEALMQDAQVDTVHPVYFKTQEVDGRLVPELDAQNQLQGVGFGEVLDHLEAEL